MNRLLLAVLLLLWAVPLRADWTAPTGAGTGSRFKLQKTHTRHIQVPATYPSLAASNPAVTSMGTAAYCLQFSASGTEYIYFQWEVPVDWTGGNILVEVDWAPDSGAMSGTDTVQWTATYTALAEGETFNKTNTVPTAITVDADIAQYVSTHSAFTIAYNDANNPLAHEDHVYFRVSRNTSVANDFGGTVCVSALEIIYESDGIPETN